MIFGIGCRKKIFWYLLKLAMLTCMVNWQDEINIKTKTHVPASLADGKGHYCFLPTTTPTATVHLNARLCNKRRAESPQWK